MTSKAASGGVDIQYPTVEVTTHRTGRRGRPGYDLDSLLEVCVQQFNIHGYDATSLGILSEALGVSRSAIYHHVESKEQLLEMALERALGGLDQVIAVAETTPGAAIDRLQELVHGAVGLLVNEQPYVTLLLRLRGNSPMELEAMARRREATQRVDKLVRRAQAEGSVRPDLSAEVLTRLVMGTVNSLADWYRPDGRVDTDELGRTVTTLLFDGMATPAAQPVG